MDGETSEDNVSPRSSVSHYWLNRTQMIYLNKDLSAKLKYLTFDGGTSTDGYEWIGTAEDWEKVALAESDDLSIYEDFSGATTNDR